ncbi:hypothetical protein NXX98_16755 [Bacteroides thetaiotaomicron]|uniref:hypothetical protein n=1 Tax=Bacteroides thetaiotaomicron TaxID=818 RepID=UPI00286E0FEB|nr:hypothetical protein [Bacteroides thetaiotaomicron]MCS3009502.1 hypothetical protein [Bacteroides thetaiotaomicron]
MKKKNEKHDILADIGHYTVNNVHLKKVLTPQEFDLFDLIRYENNVSNGYISYTLIQLEVGIIQRNLIAEIKRNLIKLGFISIVDNNRTKGTKYTVNYTVVRDIVQVLNNEHNSVNRLRIADQYRTNKGLNSIVGNRISKFENTNFDISVDVDRFEKNEENKQVNCKEVILLNTLFEKLKNKEITERQYNVQSNNIKASAKQRIIFNKDKNQWIIEMN